MRALDKLRGLGDEWIGTTPGTRFQASALLAEIETYAAERRRIRVAQMAALEADNAALRAALIDAGRLDWLEANSRLSEIVINGESQDCYFYGVAGAAGLSLREVIDAVRARGAQETGERTKP